MSLHSLEVGTLIRAAEELAPLPQSAVRLAELIKDPHCDLLEITRTVRLDMALSGHLLGAANLANPKGREPLATLEQAAQLLGGAATLSMIERLLPKRADQLSEPDASATEIELWKHSVLCALATEGIAQFAKTEVPPEAFVTALMHDLGHLILERQPESEETRQLSHTQLGAQVARHWGLSASICAAIEHHHTPLSALDGPTRRLSSLVLLADAVAAEIGEGCDLGEPVRFSPALAGSMGLSLKGFQGLCEHTSQRYRQVIDSYSA